MATVVKDFKVKNGLIVEGTTGTINNFDILTKKTDDQTYIINLVGGTGTHENTPSTLVKRDASGNFAAGTITANISGNVTGDLTGNADTASTLETARTIELTGDVTGSVSFDGSQNVQISTTLDADFATDAEVATAKSEAIADANDYTDSAVAGAIDEIPVSTDELPEGTTNKYFLDSRARDAVSAGDGLNYNSTTGEFSAHLGNGLEINNGAIRIDDSVVATETDLADAISAHNASSGVHGVTGNVVGTTDAQTLSNKSLGSNLDAGAYRITNLGAPDQSTDAATKAYVDSVSEGLHIHASAVAATTGNISISNDLMVGDLIDGVTLAATNRVLVKNQDTASENGIYVVQASGAAIRAADFDQPSEVDGGDFIFVTGGNTNADTGWVQTSEAVVTIGTDPIYFTQFSGAGTFLAGNGLTLDGNTFEINETITATRSFVQGEVETHSDATTGVHGVTGNVVGTSDEQTLSHKTLGEDTVLGADLDAASAYKIVNLEDPTSNQDAATKKYVDDEVSSVGGDLTTHENATTGIHGVTGNIVGTSDSQTLTNKTIDGGNNTLSNIDNGSLVNSSIEINGYSTNLGSSVTLDTDDVSEGSTRQYFTDERAVDAIAAAISGGVQTNISVTYNGTTDKFDFVAENGVADSTTDDLDEGTNNLYFTDQRAVDALEAVVPNFEAIEIDSVAKQVAAQASVPTASTNTAVSWAKADYRSAEFLVKIASGSHTEISKIVLTMDTSDNIAITEYAMVGTNGDLGSVSADVSGSDVRLRVATLNNNSTVTAVGTLLK